MSHLLMYVLSFTLLFFASEGQYESSCIVKKGGEPVELKFFIQKDGYYVIWPKMDPEMWPLKTRDGEPRTEIKMNDFVINFSDPNRVMGYLIETTSTRDTIVNFDATTMKESIVIVQNDRMDTLSSCQFTKLK